MLLCLFGLYGHSDSCAFTHVAYLTASISESFASRLTLDQFLLTGLSIIGHDTAVTEQSSNECLTLCTSPTSMPTYVD